MPDYRVEFTVTPPLQTADISGVDTREHAIDQVVTDNSANGQVLITRCVEIPPEVAPS